MKKLHAIKENNVDLNEAIKNISRLIYSLENSSDGVFLSAVSVMRTCSITATGTHHRCFLKI